MSGVTPRRRPHLAAAMAFAAVALAVTFAWDWTTPEGVLRERLARWQFWTLELQFLILAATTIHQLRDIARTLELSGRTWMALGAICLFCLAAVALVAPRTSRILFDEQIYQGIGQDLADTRVAQMCNDGTVEYGRLQCWSGEYNKQPPGYPYLLSVAYRLAGVHPAVAHVVNNVAAAALAAVVFLIVALVFGDARAAIGSALVMSLMPMQLVWSNTAAAEPTAALACALAALAAFQFVHTRSTPALVWMVAAAAFAASFRPECVFMAAFAVVLVAVMAPGELLRPRLWWAAAGATLVGWNVLAHALAVRHEDWGSVGQRMAIEYLGRNLGTNGLFYVWDARFPMVFTVLALAGLAVHRTHRAAWALVLYFVMFWGVFLFFYAGSYDYGADVRYSLMTYPPLAMLAGLGGAAVLSIGRGRGGRGVSPWWAAAALLFHTSLYAPLVRAEGEEAWAARADVAFVDRAVASLPANAVVLSHVPSLFLVRGVNAAQTSIATNANARIPGDFFERYAGGVYLHWNFWCNVADPAQQAFCTGALDRFDHDLIMEERVRTYRFALYRLHMPRGSADNGSGPR